MSASCRTERRQRRAASFAVISAVLVACSSDPAKPQTGASASTQVAKGSGNAPCEELRIEPPPETIVRSDPHAVARAFAYWCQQGDPDAIDARLPQLVVDKPLLYDSFLRSVCDEFGAPEVRSMSDDEKRFLTAAVWLRPEGSVRKEKYTVWYYSILDRDRKPTARTSWLSLHCDAACAPTGIFWPNGEKQFPIPDGLTKCSKTP